jgi:hypothetical protein
MVKIVKPKNGGGVLVVVTGIGTIMTLLSFSIIMLGGHGRLISAKTGFKIRARTAADAGLVDARFKMDYKLINEAVWDNSTLPAASSNLTTTPASFNYTVTGSPPLFTITSTGTSGNTQENVYAMLSVSSYWSGLGVKETINVKLGALFNTIPPGSDLDIRTNSTSADAITFKAFVTVPGDVIVGPGGDTDVVINTKATTVIQGNIYPASEELLFPDVDPPTGTTYVSTPITTTQTIPGGSLQYDTINLGNSQVLTIDGPTILYVTGTTTLHNSAEIIVAAGGSLELYLGGDLVNQNSVGFDNETNVAANLKIYGLPGCTSMDLKAKSDLYAAVYAPNADVVLFNTGDFIGSLVGNSFEMKNSGNFVYDISLSNVGIDDPATCFTLDRWWED